MDPLKGTLNRPKPQTLRNERPGLPAAGALCSSVVPVAGRSCKAPNPNNKTNKCAHHDMYVCTCLYRMYVYMNVHIYIYICVCVYVCMSVCMYVCMYECMNV